MKSQFTLSHILRLLVRKQAWPGVIQRGTQTQSPRLSKAMRKQETFGESGYPLLVLPFAAFCLGTWQVKRRWWKLDLIEMLETKTQSPPVPLPDDLDDLSELEYRSVTLSGEFDHSKEMYVGPRSNVHKEGGGLVSAGNQTGANIITPFKLADREETILVNRGWVSSKQVDPRSRREGQVTGPVDISGIVRLQENRPPFVAKTNEQSRGHWLFRDVNSMAEHAGTLPVFIDQDLKTSVEGGPVGGQTRVTLRNEHLSYIITWYLLSAITFYMWFRRYRRPPPPDSAVEYLKRRRQQK